MARDDNAEVTNKIIAQKSKRKRPIGLPPVNVSGLSIKGEERKRDKEKVDGKGDGMGEHPTRI